MRSVMRACIGSNRAPDGRYAEIDLPASPYRLLNALDEIGIKSTKEIVYQEILNYGSFGYLEPHFDEYTMLEELNALAQKLAVFDRVDSIAFEGLPLPQNPMDAVWRQSSSIWPSSMQACR